MRRTIEISASFTGKISTGQFENSSPFYSIKEVYEPDQFDTFTDDRLKIRQQELQAMCYSQFKRDAEQAFAEKIAKQHKNFRFYDAKDGLKYPSVTSIINANESFHIAEDELNQYSARGTIIHKQVEIFLQTGEWKPPKDIAEVSACYLAVVKGSLGLDLEDVDFRAFYKEYPFKVICLESQVLNDEYRYGGRTDIQCLIESANPGKWAKIEGVKFDVPTILDIKTSTALDTNKGLMQQAAYAMACNEKRQDKIAQIGLIHLTKENKCGYATPKLTSNIERYFALFLKLRNDFKSIYSI